MEIISQESSNLDFSGTFSFESLDPQILSQGFKKVREYLLKWGLDKSLHFRSFRFNLKFEELNVSSFLVDFFNSPMVLAEIEGFLSGFDGKVINVKTKKLRTSLINLDLFDRLEEKEIVVKDNIKGIFEEPFEGIEIQDLLRQLILKEESENYELFSENERNELLFRIFKTLVVGGSLCQYENLLSPYLEITKIFYKALVSAKKDAASNSVFIESSAFEIEEIGKMKVKSDHPQNFVYVIISPGGRTVHILENRWEKYW